MGGTYSVEVANGNCSVVDSSVITYFPQPVLTSLMDTSLCSGDSVLLDAGSVPGQMTLWSTGDTTSQITVSVSGIYSVTGSNHCGVLSDSATVTFFSLPIPSLAGQDTLCSGDIVQISATGGGSYLWSTGDTTASILLSPSVSGWLSTQVTDANGCQGKDSIWITVHPLPQAPTITQNGNLLISSAGYTYQWLDWLGLISGATDSTYAPGQSGRYWVEITDSNGCSSISDPYLFLYTGFSGASGVPEVKLFPNPNSGRFLVDLGSENHGFDRFEIWSVLGQQLKVGEIDTQQRRFQVQCEDVRNGVAYLLVVGEEKTVRMVFQVIR